MCMNVSVKAIALSRLFFGSLPVRINSNILNRVVLLPSTTTTTKLSFFFLFHLPSPLLSPRARDRFGASDLHGVVHCSSTTRPNVKSRIRWVTCHSSTPFFKGWRLWCWWESENWGWWYFPLATFNNRFFFSSLPNLLKPPPNPGLVNRTDPSFYTIEALAEESVSYSLKEK